jgi:methyl-accepting chemotaxis protein
MNQLKISTRLSIGFAALVTMVALMAAFGLYEVKHTNASTRTIYEDRVVALKQLKAVSDLYGSAVVDATVKAALGIEPPAKSAAQVEEATVKLHAQWKNYTATFLTEKEKQGVAQVQQLMVPADALVARLGQTLGKSDASAIAPLIAPMYTVIDPLTDEIDKLVNLQIDESQAEYERAKAAYERSVLLFGAVVAIAVLIGATIGYLLVRAITVPLNKAVSVARAIAAGDLTQEITVRTSDEMGDLLAALK